MREIDEIRVRLRLLANKFPHMVPVVDTIDGLLDAIDRHSIEPRTAMQEAEEIDLLNAHKVKLDTPGYFYRVPFFIKRDKPGEKP